MFRSFDPEPFDLIANAPGVREWIGGTGPVDTAPLVENPENWCFLTGHGGAYVYVRTDDGVYDVHSLALAAARDRQMLEARSESLRRMFCEGARTITTTVPDGNRGAAIYARQAGFRLIEHEDAALNVNGEMVGVSRMELTFDMWLARKH